jgi:PAS domain-containing protein
MLLSDLLLYSVVHDRTVIARLETAKGWAFVASSALLLYAVIRRSAAQLTKAHRTIAAVVESIGDGVLILASDRTIAYANPASLQMLRTTNLEDLRGMGAWEFSRRFRVSYLDGRLVPPDQFVAARVRRGRSDPIQGRPEPARRTRGHHCLHGRRSSI